MIESSLQSAVLGRIYIVYAEWAKRFAFVCGKGCAGCCTSSVTMTSLEGRLLRNYLQENHRWADVAISVQQHGPSTIRPAVTFNHFALICLEQQDSDPGDESPWDMTPCLFLQSDCCSVYSHRPFGCRAFGSLTPCAVGRSADVPALLLTVNTMVMQLIEHLDQGGVWGNMADVLRCLANLQKAGADATLLANQRLPGFLIPHDERPAASAFLSRLCQESVQGISIGRVLGLADC